MQCVSKMNGKAKKSYQKIPMHYQLRKTDPLAVSLETSTIDYFHLYSLSPEHRAEF